MAESAQGGPAPGEISLMARIRSLKPELWMSPQVMDLSHPARLLFIGIITQADDEGRGSADPRRLKAAVFPGDDVLAAQVAEWLGEVETRKLVCSYDGGEHGRLYWIPTWSAHQAIERRRERLGEQIERDTDLLLQRESASDDSGRLRLLLSLSQGARTVFDQRTHRQVRQVFARFSYVFLAARLLEDRETNPGILFIRTSR